MSKPPDNDNQFGAGSGDLAAQLRMAEALLEQGDVERAREWLRRAANARVTEPTHPFGKGLLSKEPYGVPEGIGWATSAARDGDAEAEHLLAIASAEGLGVRQDFEAALDHLQRSAELGHPQARAELAALAGDW